MRALLEDPIPTLKVGPAEGQAPLAAQVTPVA
jgi:hypothetical protein